VRIFRFIAATKAEHSIQIMCRVLEVSRSGFHAWERREPSPRALADEALTGRIAEIHADSRKTYGSPRVHAELRLEDDVRVGRKRVERLMRRAGLSGQLKRRRGRTTIRVQGVRTAPDLVERDFNPSEPNRLWAADITYATIVIDTPPNLGLLTVNGLLPADLGVGDARQRLGEELLPADLAHQRELDRSEVAVRRKQVHAMEVSRHGVPGPRLPGQDLDKAEGQRRRDHAELAGECELRIEVDAEHRSAVSGELGREVERGGRLADAALLLSDGDDHGALRV